MPGNSAFPVAPDFKVPIEPDNRPDSRLRAWSPSSRIAHISDIHCGDPHFVPGPDGAGDRGHQRAPAGHRRVLRRPHDVRVQGGVPPGEAVPRHGSSASRSSSSPGTTTRATSATSTSRSSSASGTRCCARTASPSSRSTRPSPISITARSAAAATAGSSRSSRSRRGCACSSCTTTCSRSPAPGGSGTSSTTRVTRSNACNERV